MAWPKDSAAAFSGGSGQMAVISELLNQKCNVAIPHIDIGTDVFAFRDDREDVARIQVKTAAARPYSDGVGFSARFGVPLTQLERADIPPLYFALAVRLEHRWDRFLIIGRSRLNELWNEGCGSHNHRSGNIEFHVQFRSKPEETAGAFLTATCGEFDLSRYLNDWHALPPLRPIAPIPADID